MGLTTAIPFGCHIIRHLGLTVQVEQEKSLGHYIHNCHTLLTNSYALSVIFIADASQQRRLSSSPLVCHTALSFLMLLGLSAWHALGSTVLLTFPTIY